MNHFDLMIAWTFLIGAALLLWIALRIAKLWPKKNCAIIVDGVQICYMEERDEDSV